MEKTRKELSQKPAAMRKRESTVVTKQLLRARTRCEKLSPSWRRDRAPAPPAAEEQRWSYTSALLQRLPEGDVRTHPTRGPWARGAAAAARGRPRGAPRRARSLRPASGEPRRRAQRSPASCGRLQKINAAVQFLMSGQNIALHQNGSVRFVGCMSKPISILHIIQLI